MVAKTNNTLVEGELILRVYILNTIIQTNTFYKFRMEPKGNTIKEMEYSIPSDG